MALLVDERWRMKIKCCTSRQIKPQNMWYLFSPPGHTCCKVAKSDKIQNEFFSQYFNLFQKSKNIWINSFPKKKHTFAIFVRVYRTTYNRYFFMFQNKIFIGNLVKRTASSKIWRFIMLWSNITCKKRATFRHVVPSCASFFVA